MLSRRACAGSISKEIRSSTRANPGRPGDAKPTGLGRPSRLGYRKDNRMNMTRTGVLGVVCLVLSAAAVGCASEQSARAGGAATVQAAAPADEMWIGPTRAESTDPTVLAWQNELLAAMGRDGEYSLFDYVVSPRGQVYVGVQHASLGLSPDQQRAAEAVNAKYARTSAGAFAKGSLWLATQAAPNGGSVATMQP